MNNKTTGINIENHKTGLNEVGLKERLDFERDTHKLRNEFREKIILNLVSSSFLVFFITLLIVCSGLYYMSRTEKLNDIIDYWKLIIPVVTTYMGYAIGRGTIKENG